MTTVRPVIAASGLNAEARIALGPGVVTVAGGGDPARFALLLQGALMRGARAVISFGIAGGLAPSVKPGTTIIGRSVDDGTSRSASDSAWVERLAAQLPHAIVGDIAGVDRMVVGADGKQALHAATGAVAVDMESHIAARLAAQHRLPFVALRVVADPAHRSLPHAATVGMRPDGTTDAGAVLRSLSKRPGDIPALIRTAFDARAAFVALSRSRRALCAHLGFDMDDQPVAEGAWAWEHGPAGALEAALFGTAPGDIQVDNS
jgi:hopanoid-associated phosphorylase